MKSTTKKKKVVVAMSGGVDSSVAAALLKDQGYDVIGVTMQIWHGKKDDGCCSLAAVEDARRVANQLGIPYYVLNFKEQFKRAVIDNFISEYEHGRTPNPCIRCNQFIKFDELLKKAKALGASFLATGHYARIEKGGDRYLLKKGADPKKDQSYFLYPIKQKILSKILFPVGGLTKDKVRELAKKYKLKVADKKESQDVCFAENGLTDLFDQDPGDIIDKTGKIIGRHKGYRFYTIGQRRGLGIADEKPKYVVRIDPEQNELAVGDDSDVYGDELIAGRLNWVSGQKLSSPRRLFAKIRYNSAPAEAMLSSLAGGKYKVKFNKPQFAITPGQSVVFYDGDAVVGGGVIEESI